jgi:hypothetical protein
MFQALSAHLHLPGAFNINGADMFICACLMRVTHAFYSGGLGFKPLVMNISVALSSFFRKLSV